MLYVYALVDADPRPLPPGTTGHADAPLCVVARGRIAAVCSRHDDVALPADAEHLWRHERVVEALMEDHAVLPVRFGTAFADDDALAVLLEERAPEFVDALARVRGRVEIAVRALWSPPEPPADDRASGPGATYLRGRLHTRAAASALAASLHGRLAASAAEARHEVLLTPRLLMSGTYLIERCSVDRFLEAADEAGREHPDVELLCTGPWPAHTFAIAPGAGLS